MVFALVLIAFAAGFFVGGIVAIRSLPIEQKDDVLLLDERIVPWEGRYESLYGYRRVTADWDGK